MQSELLKHVSPRGQPVPQDVLDSIAGDSTHKFYSEDQPRDDHGRFTDEGGMSATDKSIIDYIPERPMTDPSKLEPIKQHLPNSRYVPYSRTPFFRQVEAMHAPAGVTGGLEYKQSRDKFFQTLPVADIPLDQPLVTTQDIVNTDELAKVAKRPDPDLSDKPVHAVKHNGETYMLNGHHRIVSAADMGLKSVKGHLLDLDKKAPFTANTPQATSKLRGDVFEITHPSGASVSGYARNQDFPNEYSKPDRGEVFLTDVPEAARHKGLGYSLSKDAVALIKHHGSKTVNLAPTSPGGRRIVAKLIEDGIVGPPLRTSTTGKAEHPIL
jgi:hypothetical protein